MGCKKLRNPYGVTKVTAEPIQINKLLVHVENTQKYIIYNFLIGQFSKGFMKNFQFWAILI